MASIIRIVFSLLVFILGSSSGNTTIRISGSRTYPVQNEPFTFTCTFTSTEAAVRELVKNEVRVQAVQLGGNDGTTCYNTTDVPVICDPTSCSCSQQNGIFTARWTLPSVNDALSKWKCSQTVSQSTELELKIAIPVTSVRLDGITGSQIPAVSGMSKLLTCITGESRPRSYVQWYIGGTNYTINSTSTVINGQDEKKTVRSVLAFTPTRDMANMAVNCKAFNIYPYVTVELQTKPTLDIQYGPDMVNLDPSTLNYIVNETYQLGPVDCSAVCKPMCSYRWTGPSTDVSGYTLTINNINRNNTGIYRCTASNYLSNRSSQDVVVTVHYAAELKHMLISGGNFTIPEHSKSTITCSADGLPLPTITLRSVTNNSIIARSKGQLTLQYSFPFARCEDMGNYSCEALNTFTPKQPIQRRLSVLCTPRLYKTFERDYEMEIGDTLHIFITILAYPKLKNELFFQDSTTCNTTVISDGQRNIHFSTTLLNTSEFIYVTELTMNNLQQYDFGTYFLTSRNIIGSRTHNFFIVAKGPPSVPFDFETTISNDNFALLQWKSNFNGGSSQTFNIDYKANSETVWKYHRKINDEGKGACHADLVSSLKPNTHYVFRLYASNSMGNSTTVYVNVTTENHGNGNDHLHIYQTGVVLCSVGSFIFVVNICIAVKLFLKYRNVKTSSQRSRPYCTSE